MMFKILADDTNRIIVRSQVHPADNPTRPNLRLMDLFDGEAVSQVYVRSKFDSSNPDDYTDFDPVTGEVEQVHNPTMVACSKQSGRPPHWRTLSEHGGLVSPTY
jgi:hypothetical protein